MLTVNDVSIELGGKRIVEGVSFTAHAGTVTGLIGPNGAGKSTLLSALSGDIPLASGSIKLSEKDPQNTPVRELARTRSVMLQDVGVAFSFLVRDVVEMGRRPWARTDQAQFDDEIIDAAMDIRFQEQSLGLIRELAAHGATVIVVLHDLNAAAAYCDDIVCLDSGSVAASGPVKDVFNSEILSKVYGWPIEVTTTSLGIHVAPQRAREGSLSPALIAPFAKNSDHSHSG